MNKKNLIISLLLCIIILAGCKVFEKKECRDVACGGSVSCSFEKPNPCLAVIWPDDRCGAFASCAVVKGECVINKTDDYDKCHACFNACESRSDNCTRDCVLEYRSKLK